MKTLLFDFSRVILFPVDNTYTGSLNKLHKSLSQNADYKFLNNFRFNEELVNYLEENKEKYNNYIFTTGTIQNNPEVQERIKQLFIEMFTVDGIGYKKDDKLAYEEIKKRIGDIKGNITFIDDTEANLTAAKLAGFEIIHYEGNDQLFSLLNNKPR